MGEVNPEFASHSSDGDHSDGHDSDDHDAITDVNVYEWIAWTPLLLGIVVFGVYPQLMFKVMDPAVTELVKVFNK
jgi:NADH-quinone oxidoreductase subunit M